MAGAGDDDNASFTITAAGELQTGASFDFDYFQSKHLPEVGKAFIPYGLGYASVLRGEENLHGGDPAYFVTIILSFAEEEAARGCAPDPPLLHQREALDAVHFVGALGLMDRLHDLVALETLFPAFGAEA